MSDILYRGIRKITAKKRSRIILISAVFLIAAAVLVVGLVYRTGSNPDREALLKIIPDNVDLQIKNFHYTEVGDAHWKWEINADTARYAKKDNLAFFDNVKMRIIRSDGKIMTLSGKKGRLHTDTKNALISGNVLVETNGGERIRTDQLHFANAEKKVFTDDPVVFNNEQLTIRGTGMTFLIPEEKVTLHQQVRAVYNR